MPHYARRDHSQTYRLDLAQAVLSGNLYATISKHREPLHNRQECAISFRGLGSFRRRPDQYGVPVFEKD